MQYSFIIPLYNEAESLPELASRLENLTKKLSATYEIIFIDDGSTDNSLTVLKELNNKYSNLKIITFKKNNGKSLALQAGFNLASGEYIITLDADLQDDTEEIPKLIEALTSDKDLISGWKINRKDPFEKLFFTKIFNFIVRKFSNINLHDFNCGLKIYRRELAKELNLYGELHRFIPVIANNLGYNVAEISVNHRQRKYGKSKYNWQRIPKGFIDFLTILFLTNYSHRPLHFFGFGGFILLFFGLISGIYLTFLKIYGISISGRPLLFLSVLLIISGFQFIFTGLLAEMILFLMPKKQISGSLIKND